MSSTRRTLSHVDRADASHGGSSGDGTKEDGWRFETFADSMPQLVWTAAVDGTVEYYNARVQAYLGPRRTDDGSWEWRPTLHPEDAAVTEITWQHAVATRGPYVCEHRVRMADGTYRWHLSRAELVSDPSTGEERWFG